MTRVTKLVMQGFKSFAKRTEILFDDSFNVVLGPNGSGKSNILDALCFVLGRMSSKSMRVEKLSNLIYNGGKTKKPAEKCEVSIFFDNKNSVFPLPAESVKITRMVKKDGSSVYKINDKKATRQQIIDMMSAAKIDPEGYNIILQGDIIRFVEMSSEERRMLIEEIAGISIYEDKKNKALNELQKVEQSFREAEILLIERKTHLKELKEDRDEALKYKDINDKIKQSKATYVSIQITKQERKERGVLKDIEENKQLIQKTQDEINGMKQDIENKKTLIEQLDVEINEKSEKESVKLHQSIEQLKVDIATRQQRLELCDTELKKLTARKEQLDSELKDIELRIDGLMQRKKEIEQSKTANEKDLTDIEKGILRFRERNKLEDIAQIEQDIEQIEKEAELKQIGTQALTEKKQNLLREKDRLDMQIQGMDDRISKIVSEEDKHKEELKVLEEKRKNFKKLILDLNIALNEDSSFAARLGEARRNQESLREEFSKLRAREAGIKEKSLSNLAVKRILEQKSKFPGIIGLVSELANVKSKYALAMEVAAGPRISSIVTETDETAADCIKYLKKQKLGIATFLPLNKLKEKAEDEFHEKYLKMPGVHGKAITLIEYDPRYKKVFSYVFGNTLVVDDIDTARKVGVGNARMATMEGDLVELSGAMHGGFRQKRAEGLGFQEDELIKGIEQMEKKIDETDSLIKVLEKKKLEQEEKITKMRHEKAELEGELISAEKSLHLEHRDVDVSKKEKQKLADSMKKIDDEMEQLQTEASKINSEIAQIKTRKQKLRDKISELRNPALLAELNAFEQKRTQLREALMQIDNEQKNIEMQLNNVFIQERVKINNLFKQIEKEELNFKKEQAELSEDIKKQKESLKEMEANAAQFYAKYKALFNKKGKESEELQRLEERILGREESIRNIEQKNNLVSLKNAEIVAQLSSLRAEFEQYSGVEILEKANEEELKTELFRFEQVLVSMGNVNLKALEIYESVEQQYNELLKKKEILVSEKNDVMFLINEIESKKKDLFMNTFNVVNDNFKKTFLSLSAKGEAFLMIENPENIFEAGVRILVRLTGTKFLDIRSLSGGEKTLTALAFIFSIQEHEPASFYVLDEVDAALDKKNSQLLATLIKKYAEKAQYIVISHNDSLVQSASTLYGISMDENGMSNVVSLRV